LGERFHVGATYRGGDPLAVLHEVCQGAEPVTDVRRDDQAVDALWIPFEHRRHDVARVIHDLVRAEATDPGLVLRQRRRDDLGTASRGELNGVRAYAPRRKLAMEVAACNALPVDDMR
jgi:hypothetical protein